MNRLRYQVLLIRIDIPLYVIRFKLDISVNKLSRAFNFEDFLEKVDDVFNESGECNEQAFKILLSEEYQRLFKQTFPTESEITLINSMSNLQSSSQTECWLIKVIIFYSDCQE
jgi:hypothetical protein